MIVFVLQYLTVVNDYFNTINVCVQIGFLLLYMFHIECLKKTIFYK